MSKSQPRIFSVDSVDSKAETARHLNTVLRNELTGINQYFLHARMLKHMGFMKLADFEYKESIDEMKHADQIINRLLFLGATPNLQEFNKINIGDTVDKILAADLALEDSARDDLKAAIAHCEGAGNDPASAGMLRAILESEDTHVQFIRTQLNLIDTMGLTAYLQTQV